MANNIRGRLQAIRLRVYYALADRVGTYAREKRMAQFVERMEPTEGMRILDVGGQAVIWDTVETPLKITCLNLPGIAIQDHPTHHDIEYVEGDGCSMPQYEPGDFDIVFSNSVIEHVGGPAKESAFAAEVRRIGTRYWVQTPSKLYPMEPHSGMPFWFFYPPRLQRFFLERWRPELPQWTEMVEDTTILTRRDVARLFPDSETFMEWLIFPKSIVAYRA